MQEINVKANKFHLLCQIILFLMSFGKVLNALHKRSNSIEIPAYP